MNKFTAFIRSTMNLLCLNLFKILTTPKQVLF